MCHRRSLVTNEVPAQREALEAIPMACAGKQNLRRFASGSRLLATPGESRAGGQQAERPHDPDSRW